MRLEDHQKSMSSRTSGIYSEPVSTVRKAGKGWEPLLVCLALCRRYPTRRQVTGGSAHSPLIPYKLKPPFLHLEAGDFQTATEEGASGRGGSGQVLELR